jgi:hypothetical protein
MNIEQLLRIYLGLKSSGSGNSGSALAFPSLFDIQGQSIIPPENGKYCEGEIISIYRKRIGRREPGM